MNELDKLHYKSCYFCGRHTDLHKHHIYFGANRKVSERIGAWVYLCSYHHNMGGKEIDFIQEIGKSYLND